MDCIGKDCREHLLESNEPNKDESHSQMKSEDSKDNNHNNFKTILSLEAKNQTAELSSSNIDKQNVIKLILKSFSQLNDENLPNLGYVPDIVMSCFPNVENTDVSELSNELIGEVRKKKTLLHYAVEEKMPLVLEKLLKTEFKNENYNKFRNSAFNEAIQAFFVSKNLLHLEKQNLKKIIEIFLRLNIEVNQAHISDAIKFNCTELLDIYLKNNGKSKNLILKLKTIPKGSNSSGFHEILETANIVTIKYLLKIIGKDALLIPTRANVYPKDILTRRINNLEIDSECKSEFKILLQCIYNKCEMQNNFRYYQQELFYVDAKLLHSIFNVLQKILELYKNKRFMSTKELNSNRFLIYQCSDDFIQFENGNQSKSHEFLMCSYLKEIANSVGVLSNHDGGIKNKFQSIPWDALKSLPNALEVKHKINELNQLHARKLFEQLSPDLFKLHNRFRELATVFALLNVDSYEKFIKMNSGEVLNLYNMHKITKDFLNENITSSTLRDIAIIESLDTLQENGRFSFIQCLQILGENYKHFTPDKKKFLQDQGFNVIKEIRDDLAHAWSKSSITNKLFKVLEGSSLNNEERCETNAFFASWRNFMTEYKAALLNDGSVLENNIRTKPFKLSSLLEKIELNKLNILGSDLIDFQCNLVKYVINKIKIIVEIITDNDSDYNSIRLKLHSTTVHYTCVLMLTIIGEAIHTIRNKEDFMSIVSFELLHELDFLKWVRNALMHSDDVNETGTLVDYLSNDLLDDFSIATHGHKIIEFYKYFQYILNLVNQFQSDKASLVGDNYFQLYSSQDKKYFAFDINKRQSLANKLIQLKNKNSYIIDFHIYNLMCHKKVIEEKCASLGLEIVGLFGNLGSYGFAKLGDSSGLLIDTLQADLLDVSAKFKKFMHQTLQYKLKIVEKRQFVEYLKIKICDETVREELVRKFLTKVQICSLDNLENNIELLDLLHNASDMSDESFVKFCEISNCGRVCFELDRCTGSIFNFNNPVLHSLCDNYLFEDNKKDKWLNLIKCVLDNHADINVQNAYKETIFHKLAENYDKDLFDLLKMYSDTIEVNRNYPECQCILERSLLSHNYDLIEFFKHRTNPKLFEKQLLFSSVRSGNIDFLKYLIDNCEADVNVRDENYTSLIYSAIFYRVPRNGKHDYISDEDKIETIPENLKVYRDIILLLVEHGAQVHYNTKSEKISPLIWSLKLNDTQLALFMTEGSTIIARDSDNIYPIHMAIENKAKYPEERQNYIRIIEKMAGILRNRLEMEWKCGQETPLYLAAKLGDTDVMKILIKNGADVNYKSHRFGSILKTKNVDVIKLFIDNGMRVRIKELSFYELPDYFCNYMRLFSLYSEGGVDELKELVLRNSLNVNILNYYGKNLLWYAITKCDVNFVEWLCKNFSVTLNIHYIYNENMCSYRSYYYHLSNRTNGELLDILQRYNKISWNEFNDDNIMSMSVRAILKNDVLLLEMLERYCYIIIPEHIQISPYFEKSLAVSPEMKQAIEQLPSTSGVKLFLTPYIEICDQIENEFAITTLKSSLNKLKNKYFFYYNQSLLHIAVKKNRLDLIEFLLSSSVGLDPQIVNACFKESLLDFAIMHNSNFEVIHYLIDKHVKITSAFNISYYEKLTPTKKKLIFDYINKDEDQKTTLMSQESYSSPEYVKLLLDLGWDPNNYNEQTNIFVGGQTPLHICAYKGYNDSLRILCEYEKIDFELPIINFIIYSTSGMLTAVGFALENNNFIGAKILIEHGASPYKYLIILVLNALCEKDIDYVNFLLEKSVLIDFNETDVYLNHWTQSGFKITNNKVNEAVDILLERKNDIKNMPDFIFNYILYLRKASN